MQIIKNLHSVTFCDAWLASPLVTLTPNVGFYACSCIYVGYLGGFCRVIYLITILPHVYLLFYHALTRSLHAEFFFALLVLCCVVLC
jgi:hypothetical protein